MWNVLFCLFKKCALYVPSWKQKLVGHSQAKGVCSLFFNMWPNTWLIQGCLWLRGFRKTIWDSSAGYANSVLFMQTWSRPAHLLSCSSNSQAWLICWPYSNECLKTCCSFAELVKCERWKWENKAIELRKKENYPRYNKQTKQSVGRENWCSTSGIWHNYFPLSSLTFSKWSSVL